jgi:beta-lactamase regulating signal transducer with metallopeptidase domain
MVLIHTAARVFAEWMVYCLLEGSGLALLVGLLLWILPRQNSRTRFALWFSVLLAMIVLPFLALSWRSGNSVGQSEVVSPHSFISLPGSWAVWIFAFWVTVAGLTLSRVVMGLWQVHRLRRNSVPVDSASLDPAVREIIAEFRHSRPVTLCLSEAVQVPTAIGFLKPAVVMPEWFLKESSVGELKHVLLHELTHLRRRDDWTNLVQQTIKALLFYHPSVWWIGRELSLEREMACDDAVLAQAVTPHEYAQCLKHVAEKSFARRQLALAQAAVARVRQLSLRLTQILDVNRPRTTRLWKPAIPLVAVMTLVCALTVWNVPEVVHFEDAAGPLAPLSTVHGTDVQQSAASTLRNSSPRQSVVEPKMVLASATTKMSNTKDAQGGGHTAKLHPLALPVAARNHRTTVRPLQSNNAMLADYVIQREQLFVTMTSEQVDASGQQVWRVHVWQLRIVVPSGQLDQGTSQKKI